jgi:hypothetical protein
MKRKLAYAALANDPKMNRGLVIPIAKSVDVLLVQLVFSAKSFDAEKFCSVSPLNCLQLVPN